MARVALTAEQKKEHRIKELTGWVVSQMHIHGLYQDEVAKKLGIKQSSLSARLNPEEYKKKLKKDPFSYGDMLILFQLFDTPLEEIGRLMKL